MSHSNHKWRSFDKHDKGRPEIYEIIVNIATSPVSTSFVKAGKWYMMIYQQRDVHKLSLTY